VAENPLKRLHTICGPQIDGRIALENHFDFLLGTISYGAKLPAKRRVLKVDNHIVLRNPTKLSNPLGICRVHMNKHGDVGVRNVNSDARQWIALLIDNTNAEDAAPDTDWQDGMGLRIKTELFNGYDIVRYRISNSSAHDV